MTEYKPYTPEELSEFKQALLKNTKVPYLPKLLLFCAADMIMSPNQILNMKWNQVSFEKRIVECKLPQAPWANANVLFTIPNMLMPYFIHQLSFCNQVWNSVAKTDVPINSYVFPDSVTEYGQCVPLAGSIFNNLLNELFTSVEGFENLRPVTLRELIG